MRGEFTRELGSLGGVLGLVDRFAQEHGLDERTAFATRLVVEELFANFVRHNRGGVRPVEVELTMAGGSLEVRLWDHDVAPFRVPERAPVEIGRPLDERTAGGLGLHFVRSYFDELTYGYSDGTVCVTARRNLWRTDVRHQTGG